MFFRPLQKPWRTARSCKRNDGTLASSLGYPGSGIRRTGRVAAHNPVHHPTDARDTPFTDMTFRAEISAWPRPSSRTSSWPTLHKQHLYGFGMERGEFKTLRQSLRYCRCVARFVHVDEQNW
jgi:hypothetical protein